MKLLKNAKLPLLLLFLITFTTLKSQDKENEKLQAASNVLNNFVGMKEKIPQKLLEITQGIIVVPKLINAGFVVGGKRGRGIAVVKREDGTWSDPASA